MWEKDLPVLADVLRQGDLLAGLPFPRRGTFELTASELRANVFPAKPVVVLDQCCTVTQKMTVLLGRVSYISRLADDHHLMQALSTDVPEVGKPYSKYLHRLEVHAAGLPAKSKKVPVIDLTERVSIGVTALEDMAWLNQFRVARMTTIARAHLRLRLLSHFTTEAEEDAAALSDAGLDTLGRPPTLPTTSSAPPAV